MISDHILIKVESNKNNINKNKGFYDEARDEGCIENTLEWTVKDIKLHKSMHY